MQQYIKVHCTLHTRDKIRTSMSDGTALRYFHILSVASAADTVLVGSFPSKPCSHSGRVLLLFPLLLLLLLLWLLVLQSMLYGVLMLVLVPVFLLDSLCVVQPELVLELVLELEVHVEAEMTVLSSCGCLASTLCTMEKQHTIACRRCSMTLRASISAAEKLYIRMNIYAISKLLH